MAYSALVLTGLHIFIGIRIRELQNRIAAFEIMASKSTFLPQLPSGFNRLFLSHLFSETMATSTRFAGEVAYFPLEQLLLRLGGLVLRERADRRKLKFFLYKYT